MEMILNLQALLKSDMPVQQFLLFQAILEKKEELIPRILADMKEQVPDRSFRELFEQWQTDGWLKIIDNIEDHEKKWGDCLAMREKFITLVTPIHVNWFDDIWDSFPYQVPSRGGVRPLRAATKDSQNYREGKRKYLSRIKTEIKHRDVLARLRGELHERQMTGTMNFMHNLLSWINQNDWEKYQPLEEKEYNVSGQHKPGEEIY